MASVSADNGDLRERPLGELITHLAEQSGTLVQKEIELAKAELDHKGRKAVVALGNYGGAAIATLLGLGALTAAGIVALDRLMPLWLAGVLVGAAWLLVAAALALRAREHLRAIGRPVPEIMDNLKEDIGWIQTQTRSVER